MRSRSNGGVIGAYALPTQNYANGVFFIHDAAIYNTGNNPIWPLGTGLIYSASGGTISTAVDNSNYKLHTFTANGTFTVTTGSAYIDIFLVGGGGSGGSCSSSTTTYLAGGGGAGGVVTLAQQVFVTGGTVFTVEVGVGGTPVSYGASPTSINEGKPSKVTSNAGHSYFSPGGGYGGGKSAVFYNPVNGAGTYQTSYNGSTSGAAAASTGTGSPGTIISNTYAGGNQNAAGVSNYFIGSGGAGAAGPGYDSNYSTDVNKQGCGGDGYYWTRTGLYYGSGGGGAVLGSLWGNSPYISRYYLVGTSGKYYNVVNPADNQAGAGGRTTSSSSVPGNSGLNGYGGGGGGVAVQNNTNTALGQLAGAGGNGTVIFCYRYQ